MLRLFSPRSEIGAMEEAVENQMASLRDSITPEGASEKEVVIDGDFPDSFVSQIREFVVGNVDWERFFVDEDKDLYSVHGHMERGSVIQEHICPNATTLLYLIDGRLINWSRDSYGGDVIVPADQVHRTIQTTHNPAVDGWYKIEKGESHWIQSIEPSHFILKFKRE